MKYHTEALRALDIEAVLRVLGIDYMPNSKYYECPYPHKKPQAIKVYPKTNTCKCFNCNEFGGDTIKVAEYMLGQGFKEACEFLHASFNIPFLDNSGHSKKVAVLPKKKKKAIEYFTFDSNRTFDNVVLREYFGKYAKMNDSQKLKFVYTYLYRSSLQGDQSAKFAYYSKERGISKDNPKLRVLGYLNKSRVEVILEEMKSLFPTEDLLKFGILKEKDGQEKFVFDYIDQGGLIMVPSFDLYSDMVTAFMVRPTHPPKWMKKKGIKELQLSKREIVRPLPFGLTYKALAKYTTLYVTEGHPDALSIPGNKAVIASPGTYGIDEEALGLFRGKRVVLAFDQDRSGLKAAYGFRAINVGDRKEEYLVSLENREYYDRIKELRAKNVEHDTSFTMGLLQKLTNAGIKSVEVLTWDPKYGSDINDLAINGNLEIVFGKEGSV